MGRLAQPRGSQFIYTCTCNYVIRTFGSTVRLIGDKHHSLQLLTMNEKEFAILSDILTFLCLCLVYCNKDNNTFKYCYDDDSMKAEMLLRSLTLLAYNSFTYERIRVCRGLNWLAKNERNAVMKSQPPFRIFRLWLFYYVWLYIYIHVCV